MHGTFKGEPPRRGAGPAGSPGLALVLRILLREAAVGVVLYSVLGRNAGLDAMLCAAVLVGLAALTRRFGLLHRRDYLGLTLECLVVFGGGLVFCNVLVLLHAKLAG